MTSILNKSIQIAILDLYAGEPNEGIRCIRQSLDTFRNEHKLDLSYRIYDVRGKEELPDLRYDLYISTGGPGSPLDSADFAWEKKYFAWMDSLIHHNQIYPNQQKHVLLICHSFQLFCRHYGYGKVSRRKSTSFGVMTVHKTRSGMREVVMARLSDPFWAFDSRDYQITKPNEPRIKSAGGSILCIEKYRPHVPLERAVMGIRFNETIVGFQFHPEADGEGISMYLRRPDKKEYIIKRYGEKKYKSMLENLDDPNKVLLTYQTIIPEFLLEGLRKVMAPLSQ